jgi:hypothetical protein
LHATNKNAWKPPALNVKLFCTTAVTRSAVTLDTSSAPMYRSVGSAAASTVPDSVSSTGPTHLPLENTNLCADAVAAAHVASQSVESTG